MTSEIAPLMIVMLKLAAAMGLGYWLQKRGTFTPDSNRRISEMVVTVTSPCLILAASASEITVDRSEIYLLIIAGFVIYLFLAAVAYLVSRFLKGSAESKRTAQALLIFGNASFMAYPVVEALYGKSAILLTSLVHTPFNLLIFSYGIYLLSGEAEESGLTRKQKLMQMINPGLLSAIAALLVVAFQISIPQFIVEPLQFIGNLTPALSMVVLGSILAEFPLSSMFKFKNVWVICLLRLVVMPLIIYWACGYFFTSQEILGIILTSNMMPCASSNAMFATKYGGEEQYTASAVFISTVLSLITIPIMLMLLL